MARGPCSLTLAQTCPNCGGELVRRPRRRRKPEGIHRDLEGVRQGVTRIRARETSTGTHRGLFWGVPPTGRKVVLPEISIFRVAGGRVVEQ